MNASQHEVNLGRPEEKRRRAKKSHNTTLAAELGARKELARVQAELGEETKCSTTTKDDMDAEPTDTDHLSPGTNDEDNDYEDTPLMMMLMLSTLRMVNAKGKTDSTKMAC